MSEGISGIIAHGFLSVTSLKTHVLFFAGYPSRSLVSVQMLSVSAVMLTHIYRSEFRATGTASSPPHACCSGRCQRRVAPSCRSGTPSFTPDWRLVCERALLLGDLGASLVICAWPPRSGAWIQWRSSGQRRCRSTGLEDALLRHIVGNMRHPFTLQHLRPYNYETAMAIGEDSTLKSGFVKLNFFRPT